MLLFICLNVHELLCDTVSHIESIYECVIVYKFGPLRTMSTSLRVWIVTYSSSRMALLSTIYCVGFSLLQIIWFLLIFLHIDLVLEDHDFHLYCSCVSLLVNIAISPRISS